MTQVFADLVAQDPAVPKPEDRQDCEAHGCPGPSGWTVGYGMAGGGIGPYTYCERCERIIDKYQDPEMGPDPTSCQQCGGRGCGSCKVQP